MLFYTSSNNEVKRIHYIFILVLTPNSVQYLKWNVRYKYIDLVDRTYGLPNRTYV